MTAHAVTVADIEAAARRIDGHAVRTPLIPLSGLDFLAKCETFQPTGAFKFRGATNAVMALRPRGVVTASSGNHAQAMATAAAAVGIPCTVVMPVGASPYKVAATRALGATIVESDPGTEARNSVAQAISDRDGLTFIPPYDHPLVIAGQGTVGLEIARDHPAVTSVVVPLGGGGLLSGISIALRTHTTGVRIIGVEPEDGDDTVRSRIAGERVTVPPPQTICDGARTQTPGELTFPIVNDLVDDVISVSDVAVVDAMRDIARAGLVVEPTGALAVAGAKQLGLAGAICVLSGRNISPAAYAALIVGERPALTVG